MATLNASQIGAYAKAALGEGNNGITTAIAVALAESGGRTDVTNRNTDGSVDTGVWQINSVHLARHPTWTQDWLKNPSNNAKAMAVLSGNGTTWTPWSAFKNGRYRDHWGEAAKAAGTTGSVGLPDIPNPVDAVTAVPDALRAVAEAVQNAAAAALEVANRLGTWIAEPHNWQRVGFVVGGALLVVLAGAAIAGDTRTGQAVVGAATNVATRGTLSGPRRRR